MITLFVYKGRFYVFTHCFFVGFDVSSVDYCFLFVCFFPDEMENKFEALLASVKMPLEEKKSTLNYLLPK